MNPIVLSLANGTSFFVGLALVLVAEVLLLRFRKGMAQPVLTVLAMSGIVLVVISSTPLPVWAYASWAIPAITGLVALNRLATSRRWQLVICIALVASTTGLCLTEAPHHLSPRLTVPVGTTIYVLGDSISAGMGTRHRCWPEVLDDEIAFRVVNLAQPGATVESAIVQAKGIVESPSLVIVEIGGNDLLGGTEASVFHSKLDTLVSSLCASRHQVLVVELPLFPFRNAFGRAQRTVVAKYDVAMLPKRYFTKVLGTDNGTLDGLHLSQEGHDAMARIMAEVIEPD